MTRVCSSLALTLILSGLAGCSASVAQLDAKVTLRSAAVAGAEVLVEPESSGKGTLYGVTKDDGSCVFDWGGRSGLAPGKYKIVVTHYEATDGKALPTGEEGQVLKQSGKAPRRQYEFHRELQLGKNSLALALEQAEIPAGNSPAARTSP